jgi:uracil-DNA glycosylase
MNVKLNSDWKQHLESQFSKSYFSQLAEFVRSEYAKGKVYPPGFLIFNALEKTPFAQVKVVIIGQDPYHGPNQANGLCFSVNDGVQIPPSLQNIYKEIHSDLNKPIPKTGNLERWATQGVLLLNATLTVRAAQAGSHQGKGWEEFTDAIIKILNEKKTGLVFLLWGKYAQQKGSHVDQAKHLVLASAHPSPLSAHNGFFGSKHFSKANEYLASLGKSPIDW